jgi:hypothetical protein
MQTKTPILWDEHDGSADRDKTHEVQVDYGSISDEALRTLADELFVMYDEEERSKS